MMFMQTMYSIKDIHKSGVQDEDFSEVTENDVHVEIVVTICMFASYITDNPN